MMARRKQLGSNKLGSAAPTHRMRLSRALGLAQGNVRNAAKARLQGDCTSAERSLYEAAGMIGSALAETEALEGSVGPRVREAWLRTNEAVSLERAHFRRACLRGR
jgi:hypothetical protein